MISFKEAVGAAPSGPAGAPKRALLLTALALLAVCLVLVNYSVQWLPCHQNSLLQSTHPLHQATDCPVYVLDVSKEVAQPAGLPTCDIEDPAVWPNELDLMTPDGNNLAWRVYRTARIPHQLHQYAGQYWLLESLRNASVGVMTNNIEEACLVWVDMYCYQQWFLASGWVHTYRVSGLPAPVQKQAEVSLILDQVLDAVVASKRFKKRHGRDYVFPSTLPTIRDRVCKRSPLSQQLVLEGVMCGSRNKLLLREWHLVPYSALIDIHLSASVVGSKRKNFLFMRASCGPHSTKSLQPKSCGMLMRHAAATAFDGVADNVKVKCMGSGATAVDPMSHAQLLDEMHNSVFCLMPPGDWASSNRLGEAILAGCIPVFYGPPWHTMPLNTGEVDYAGMGVFLNVTGDWQNHTKCAHNLKWWQQTASVQHVTMPLPNMDAVLTYLREMPEASLRRKQEALERERVKFYYAAPPGRATSALADVVWSKLLRHGQRVAMGDYVP